MFLTRIILAAVMMFGFVSAIPDSIDGLAGVMLPISIGIASFSLVCAMLPDEK